MNSRWFKEERALKGPEREEKIKGSKEILGHSVLVFEKLERILNEEIEKTYSDDEDVGSPEWQQRALANAGARKALRNLKQLLP